MLPTVLPTVPPTVPRRCRHGCRVARSSGGSTAAQSEERALAAGGRFPKGPAVHSLPQGPTRLLRAALWARGERSRRVGAHRSSPRIHGKLL